MVVGIEATGALQWCLQLLEELGIECRVGHPAKIRAKETRQQKHDRRDARLELELLIEDRFRPSPVLISLPLDFQCQGWALTRSIQIDVRI